MKEISYIHFSDLHIGQKWATQYLSNAKDIVIDDLKFICNKLGRVGVVFFTGDLVQSGSENEYDMFFDWFEDIKKCLECDGNAPYYLFVPGNHDLVRSEDVDNSTHKILKNTWLTDEKLRDTLIWDKTKEYNQYCSKRFEAYSNFLARFYKENKLPRVYKDGLIPGDFYAEMEIGEAVLGVVGLNSSFLQIDGSDYRKKLGVYHKQISGIFGTDDYIKILRENDISLLMTHHEPEWYESESAEDYRLNIYSSEKFVEHLCGHNHIPKGVTTSYDYGTSHHLSLAPSLFGVELQNKEYERIHGYHAGKYQICENGEIKKLFYPRRAIKKLDGYDIDKDPYFHYDSKDGIYATIKLKDVDRCQEDREELVSEEDIVGKAKILSDSVVRPSTIKSDSIYDGVRQIEQEKALNMLQKTQILWVYSHFGLGEEQFVSSVLGKIEGIDNSLFVLNCEGVLNYDEFEHAVQDQFSRPLSSLIDNLSDNYNKPVLILKNVESKFVETESGALYNSLTSILNFNKQIYVVIISYSKPSASYFQMVEIKPLTIEEVKHCLEAANNKKTYKTVEIERVYSLTNGYPLYLDLALKELELVEIDDLNESDFSVGASTHNVPAAILDYITTLRDSSNANERRCFKLLRLLAFLQRGETFVTIKRFDSTNPFKPADLLELKNRDLLSTDSYYALSEGKFVMVNSVLRVPQAYRDFIISITDDREKRDIYSSICNMYFGRDWLVNNDVNINTTHKGEYCSFAFHNASVALKQLLLYSINEDRELEVIRYLRIASQFVEQLSEQSLFYVANVISEEFNTLEKNIKYEDAKKPLAYLKYIIANIKRMNNVYDEAKCLFEEVLAENNLDHEHRLTCMECLGYLYYALDDNKKAVEYANRMMKECKKNDMYNRYIAKYIKAKNGEYDNNEVRLRELQKLYKDLKKTHYRTVTINTLYEIAQYDHSQQTLNKINLELRKTGLSSYDRMRLISKKYTIMTSPELSQDLTPSDINDVQVVYYYSFMQMLTRMMEESHVILWGFYLNEKNYPELIKLMKYSSFVWEMKDNKDTINEYLDKIRNDVDFMNWIKGNLNDDYVMFLINERGL